MTNTTIGTYGYNALDIAEYIIKYEDAKDHLINNLKLQKVLYFLQAQFVVSTGNSLFDEEIVAWDFGPVVMSVYNRYKVYAGASIFINNSGCRNAYIDPVHKEIINKILEYIRPYSAWQLTQICHHQTPWMNARVRWNNVISLYELRDFFKEDDSHNDKT